MAKVNYNGTASAGSSAQVAPEHNGRQTFFFQAIGGDMVLNFGATATSANILSVAQGNSIFLNATSPYEIKKQINVYSAAANAFEAQAEQ
jgi:hypothetical protein